ncbi:MAG TPA: YceI family protein [Bacteroidia bacterium]|nr:YceI family protein [Bacteroidia bacterium]
MKTNWTIDPMHSEIQFKIRHLVISNVTGNFGKFDAGVETENDDFQTAKIRFTMDANSIDTGNEQRDAHLKSADFFDAANHPKLTFQSTEVVTHGDNTFTLKGDLTIRGTTRLVELNVEFGGLMTDPYGNIKAGFEVTGKINRRDYGLNWSAVTEAGGLVVSDEVRIVADVQFMKVIAEKEKLRETAEAQRN